VQADHMNTQLGQLSLLSLCEQADSSHDYCYQGRNYKFCTAVCHGITARLYLTLSPQSNYYMNMSIIRRSSVHLYGTPYLWLLWVEDIGWVHVSIRKTNCS